MSLVPLPGVGLPRLRDVLWEQRAALLQARGSSAGAGPMWQQAIHAEHLSWSIEATRAFTGVLPPRDVERLVTPPRYWALMGHNNLGELVRLELEERHREFDSAITEVDAVLARIKGRHAEVAVLDTSVLLEQEQCYRHTDWFGVVPLAGASGIDLVLPLKVVEELDNAKHERTRRRARQTLRDLDEDFSRTDHIVTLAPEALPRGRVSMELFMDTPGHQQLDNADAEIVDRAVAFQSLVGRRVTVLTFDAGMAFRARAAGVDATLLKEPPSPPGSKPNAPKQCTGCATGVDRSPLPH